jgi:hypothetical protein
LIILIVIIQIQVGALRIRCATCHGEAITLSTPIITWTDVYTRSFTGKCFMCGSANGRNTPQDREAQLIIKCKGSLMNPIEVDGERKTVCQSHASDLQTSALPLFQRNTQQILSVDTSLPDVYQVHFHPCGHRLSPLALAPYFRAGLPRNVLIHNLRFSEYFGQYLLKCILPNCPDNGLLPLPTCRVAGVDVYNLIKEWHLKEEILRCGGVTCLNCGVAFIPSPDERGPQRVCPTSSGGCGFVFCEQHQQQWGTCGGMAAKIRAAFLNGMVVSCPRCGSWGQKDNNCTHITCVCGKKFCYICRATLRRSCPNRCPLYLHHLDVLNSTSDSSQRRSTATLNFHLIKTVLLLQKLRTENVTLFDEIFRTLSKEDRTISFDELTRCVTMDDIIHGVPDIPNFQI